MPDYDNVGKFPWGRVVEIHTAGPYEIWEYDEYKAGVRTSPREYSGRRLFHAFVDRKDTHRSSFSLEAALISAIAWKSLGDNSYPTMFIARMLKLDERDQ